MHKDKLSVPRPVDGLEPGTTRGGVYKAIWDYAYFDNTSLMADLHDCYGACRWEHSDKPHPAFPNELYRATCIWKHLVTYIGSTNYFYGRWKQHRRGPKHQGSERIWQALHIWEDEEINQVGGAPVAFSVIHPNEELEDGFIHTSGVAKDDKTGNILHIKNPGRECVYCKNGWGITHENRCFIPRFHNIWNPNDRTWTEYDASLNRTIAVREIKQPPKTYRCGAIGYCEICDTCGSAETSQCGICYGTYPHNMLRTTWECGPPICVDCLASLQGRK